MVLYHIMSTYQLLECIEHKLLVHKEEKAILLLNQVRINNLEDPSLLHEIFEHFFVFKVDITNKNNKENLGKVEKVFKSTVKLSIEDFTEIYIAGIHTPLSAYLISKGIKFSMFEDGLGALSRPWILGDLNKNAMSEPYFEFLNQYGLFEPNNLGSNILKRKYCNVKSQIDTYEDELMENFDVITKFKELTSKEREFVLELFNCPKLSETKKKSVLLLTQQLSALRQLSFEDQVNLYQLICDYFFEGYHLIIKPHPDDYLYYPLLFPNAKIVKGKFPAELFPFLFTNQPDVLATVSSTGVGLIKDYFSKNIFFDEIFEQNFNCLHRYFSALDFIEKMEIKSIEGNGIQRCIIDNYYTLKSKDNLLNKQNKDKVVLVDDYDTKNIDFDYLREQKMVIFLNSKKEYVFYDYYQKAFFESCIPIVITKRKLNEDSFLPDEEEVIFVYCKENDMKNRVKAFRKNETKLEYSGLSVEIENLTDDQLRIKVLEGILEATEKRLLTYIENEKLTRGEDQI